MDVLDEFEGAGVYYAAREMQAQMCSGEEIMVVGGGNSAGQAARSCGPPRWEALSDHVLITVSSLSLCLC